VVPTNLRVLNLFLDLLSSEHGRTKEQMRSTPGYAGLGDSAFESRFQRDKDALRAAGVILELDQGSGPDRYRISPRSFPATDVHLDPTELSLVHMAVRAWSSVPTARRDVLLSKLAGRSEGTGTAGAAGGPAVEIDLEGADVVAEVMEAIEERRPLAFTYTSASGTAERAVEPWRLLLRGRALYLWGWDLDREATRLFRLSRIPSGVELLGEPGDARVPEGDLPDPFEERTVSPLLRVRRGAAPRVRLRARDAHEGGATYEDGAAHQYAAVHEDAAVHGGGAGHQDTAGAAGHAGDIRRDGEPRHIGQPPDDGDSWDVLRGAPDEINSWISAVLAEVTDVVVLEPAPLREAVTERLRVAAAWRPDPGDRTDGDPAEEVHRA